MFCRSTRRRSYFLIADRSPRTKLFPYTTLFRSTQEISQRRAMLVVERVVQTAEILAADRDGSPRPQRRTDRKSTRLNSSHQIISYAVFCLKQKKSYVTDRSTDCAFHFLILTPVL